MDKQIATVFTNKPLKQCMGTADNIVPLGCYFMYVHNLSVLSSIGHWPFEATAQKGNEFHVRGQNKINRSPKGNMWSAIPIALLCMVVNQNERKQGSGPEGDKVL